MATPSTDRQETTTGGGGGCPGRFSEDVLTRTLAETGEPVPAEIPGDTDAVRRVVLLAALHRAVQTDLYRATQPGGNDTLAAWLAVSPAAWERRTDMPPEDPWWVTAHEMRWSARRMSERLHDADADNVDWHAVAAVDLATAANLAVSTHGPGDAERVARGLEKAATTAGAAYSTLTALAHDAAAEAGHNPHAPTQFTWQLRGGHAAEAALRAGTFNDYTEMWKRTRGTDDDVDVSHELLSWDGRRWPVSVETGAREAADVGPWEFQTCTLSAAGQTVEVRLRVPAA